MCVMPHSRLLYCMIHFVQIFSYGDKFYFKKMDLGKKRNLKM